MKLRICKDAAELGANAGREAAEYLKKVIEENGYARIVVSTGSSQFETLQALVESDVDWSKVEMFHLDEYVDLPETHIASFRKYLKERFISKINLLDYHLVDGNPDSIPALTEKLREKDVDLGLIGIGENGHIAFNDPPADFDTTEAYIVVNLDDKCKNQQVGEGWFATLDDVPKQAISMTPYQIMKCKKIITCVPHAVKADAIEATLYSDVTNMVPATILKTHPDWTLFIDENSGAKVKKKRDSLKIRLGIIGIGNMGTSHSRFIKEGIDNIELTAVADIDPEKRKKAEENENMKGAKIFSSAEELIDSGLCDAVIVSTPHYDHPGISMYALSKGLHVMCEKPAGVYTKQVREMNEYAKERSESFGMMFCVRTNRAYRKLREIVQSGKYGEIRRVNWIVTDWYRTQAYYNLSQWRATWSGEGGGVLLNQCPHQLDLWQWICGMPESIRAVCKEGMWHDIEVEDDVTIFAQYKNGATGVFISTTGDFPGTNRLEITLDSAKLVYSDDGVIHVTEISEPLSENCKNSPRAFEVLDTKNFDIEVSHCITSHKAVLEEFGNNINYGTPMIAGGEEGINGLSISNAAHLSAWTGEEVTLPVDEERFLTLLNKKIADSKFKKAESAEAQIDMSASFK